MSGRAEYASAADLASVRPGGWTGRWARTLQVRRFAAVGVLNTTVDYVLFVGLTKLLRLSLDWVWIAKVLSGTVAIALSFWLNRRWVFRAHGATAGQAARFCATTIVGVYGIQTSLTQFFASSEPRAGKALYSVLHDMHLVGYFPSILTEAFVIKTVAFVLATAASMTFNFLVYRFWVFRDGRPTPPTMIAA
jgi:putative flippase GtrA